MTKKRSKCLFVVFSIILVICLIASFVKFTYPLSINGKYYSYSNFVENLRLGEDVGNSVRIVYRAEVPDGKTSTNYSILRDSTMSDLKSIVQAEGYKDVTVAEYGSDQIVITVGNILNEDDKNSIISLIGNPAIISFSTNSDGSDPFAGSEHIKSVSSTQYTPSGSSETSYIVIVEFKEEFKQMISDKSSGKTVYIHLGETQFAELDYSSGSIESGMIYLQSSTFESLLDATTCANQIKAGMLDLELTQLECAEISPSYGRSANVLSLIAVILFVVAGFVFLILKYKHMGWLACFNLLFFIVINLFLLQSIPLVHINFAGIIAFMVSFIVVVDTLMNIFEHAKRHYQNDTKLHIAFRVAQQECLTRTFVTNALLGLVGFMCVFMPSMAVQSFGWVAFVSALVSLFVSLVLMRLFIKMYLPFNNVDGNKCNFHKGGKNV